MRKKLLARLRVFGHPNVPILHERDAATSQRQSVAHSGTGTTECHSGASQRPTRPVLKNCSASRMRSNRRTDWTLPTASHS